MSKGGGFWVQGKEVEKIVKDWNTELQEQSRKFVTYAKKLSEWDRSILQSRYGLLDLEVELKKVCAGMAASSFFWGIVLRDEKVFGHSSQFSILLSYSTTG